MKGKWWSVANSFVMNSLGKKWQHFLEEIPKHVHAKLAIDIRSGWSYKMHTELD